MTRSRRFASVLLGLVLAAAALRLTACFINAGHPARIANADAPDGDPADAEEDGE